MHPITHQSLRIVFMGTPDFAVASLDALVNAGYNIVGVVTAPDKPAGRGMKLQESAVKKYALEKGFPVLQPVKLKNPEFLEELKKLKADVQVVVAFRMLPEQVWNMPPGGTINVHGSLLPQYRGAAPINWAIINGEKETGVTTFMLKQEIDTGDILLQTRLPIGEDETAGELHDKMKMAGAELLVETLQSFITGNIRPKAQTEILSPNDTHYQHAPRIFTETCKINWDHKVDDIHNLIRGLSPFPGAYTFLDNKMIKVFKSEKERSVPATEAGSFDTDKKTFLKFAAGDGYISIKELQMEGKKKMNISDFLRGYRF